jgi:hypothetical protein
VESFGAESPILTSRLRALLEHLGITIAPQYRIKEVLRSGWVEFKAIAEIFFESSADSRDQLSGLLRAMLLLMLPGTPSHRGSIAARADYRTWSTTSYPIGRRINSRPTR